MPPSIISDVYSVLSKQNKVIIQPGNSIRDSKFKCKRESKQNIFIAVNTVGKF